MSKVANYGLIILTHGHNWKECLNSQICFVKEECKYVKMGLEKCSP